jgi:hypothetical protein
MLVGLMVPNWVSSRAARMDLQMEEVTAQMME